MRSVVRMSAILLAGVIGGAFCLWAVYLIPVENMQRNVEKSMDIFMEEGENPFVLNGYKGSSLDNYTDAIMLGSAVYGEGDEPAAVRAMRVSRASGAADAPMESLAMYLESRGTGGEHTDYARYWHGYLVFLKPLLCFLDYVQIRILNGILLIGMLSWIVLEFLKKKMWRGAAAYLLSVCSVFPMAIPFSLQFSTIFYIGNIALLLVLKGNSIWKEKDRYLLFFEIVGMCTSYLDFLTYPLFTFGMPMVMCLTLNKEYSLKDKLCFFLKNGIAWGMGYTLMWAGKWLVGSLITGENLLSSALGVVSFRMSGQAYDESLNRIMAILRNGYIYFNLAGVILAAAVLIWIFVSVWKKRDALNVAELLPLGMAACMPVLWYFVMANHSYTHYWYTFRSLAVSVFALAMIPECIGSGTMEMKRAGKGI